MENITIKGRNYNLRLTTRAIIEIEKRLGTNPLNVFVEAQDNKMPKLNDLMVIWHGCLLDQQHNIGIDNVYRMFDDFCHEGGDLTKLVEILVKCFEDGGFIPKSDSKN